MIGSPETFRAIALDLGTTRIKAGRLDARGQITDIVSAPAPPLTGESLIRESDPLAYLAVAGALLKKIADGFPAGTPLGIATQRSSFLLWEKPSGKPLTPLISWQDRRATHWCNAHSADEKFIRETTGLRLSPHYAGPKLAALLEESPELRAGMAAGEILFGTLECWLIWNWTAERLHATDPTVAARTAMADPRVRDWDEALLAAFGVPHAALPVILPSAGRDIPLGNGLRLIASIADQAAGALTALDDAGENLTVNLGTGGFILRSTGAAFLALPGYLAGPVFGGPKGEKIFAREGTINGAASAADQFGAGPTSLPETGPAPNAFCLPDTAGIGSPHWRPALPFTLSSPAQSLSRRDQRRIVLEGIIFRLREIIDDFSRERPPVRIMLSGGLANELFLADGLAACLGRPIEVQEMPEATLTGAGRLAAGMSPRESSPARAASPGVAGGYLPEKYQRWRKWLKEILNNNG